MDVARIGYGQSLSNSFEKSNASTSITSFKADITLPIVINQNQALITGVSFDMNHLQLFPDSHFSDLYSTSLKLGLASTWSSRWSSTLVLLPKLASDYKNISKTDFYLGGLAVLKLQKNENFAYRFGMYASQEAYGVFATPILGVHYISPNKDFTMNLSLPITGDMNYKVGNHNVGIDYLGISRSFKIHNQEDFNIYTDYSSLEFAGYFQLNTFDEKVLLRAKLGYATDKYEAYAENEKIDLALSAIRFGDSRTQLNPTLQGGVFLRCELIYRFHIE